MKVRQNLGDLLNEVQYGKGRILITKAGKPVAALAAEKTIVPTVCFSAWFDGAPKRRRC
jgi:antitoxin (DNA-binding transcriptional repressor) of toxin-antitoxin stability system